MPCPTINDMLVKLIRRANLDAMAAHAASTSVGHANEILRAVCIGQMIHKSPSIQPRGPMPLSDTVGMGLAIEILLRSIMGKGRAPGRSSIQYSTMRQYRGTYTTSWESSPQGVTECTTFAHGLLKAMVTTCTLQQKWFGMFLKGAESRMGHVSMANRALPIGILGC